MRDLLAFFSRYAYPGHADSICTKAGCLVAAIARAGNRQWKATFIARFHDHLGDDHVPIIAERCIFIFEFPAGIAVALPVHDRSPAGDEHQGKGDPDQQECNAEDNAEFGKSISDND
jgi:hypothetical protein